MFQRRKTDLYEFYWSTPLGRVFQLHWTHRMEFMYRLRGGKTEWFRLSSRTALHVTDRPPVRKGALFFPGDNIFDTKEQSSGSFESNSPLCVNLTRNFTDLSRWVSTGRILLGRAIQSPRSSANHFTNWRLACDIGRKHQGDRLIRHKNGWFCKIRARTSRPKE